MTRHRTATHERGSGLPPPVAVRPRSGRAAAAVHSFGFAGLFFIAHWSYSARGMNFNDALLMQ